MYHHSSPPLPSPLSTLPHHQITCPLHAFPRSKETKFRLNEFRLIRWQSFHLMGLKSEQPRNTVFNVCLTCSRWHQAAFLVWVPMPYPFRGFPPMRDLRREGSWEPPLGLSPSLPAATHKLPHLRQATPPAVARRCHSLAASPQAHTARQYFLQGSKLLKMQRLGVPKQRQVLRLTQGEHLWHRWRSCRNGGKDDVSFPEVVFVVSRFCWSCRDHAQFSHMLAGS